MPAVLVPFIPLFAFLASGALADQNDWINPTYVVSWRASGPHSTTRDAEDYIKRAAQHRLFSITSSKGVTAPSKDPHDYLSWAPYHWPNCNWCNGKGRTYIGGSKNDTSDDGGEDDCDNDGDCGGSDDDDEPDVDSTTQSSESVNQDHDSVFSSRSHMHRMVRMRRKDSLSLVSPTSAPTFTRRDIAQAALDMLPTLTPNLDPLPGTKTLDPVSQSTSDAVVGSHTPAQAAAKHSASSSCTPSPTTSMPPSATWTTCPYIIRDGQVNPDVRTLPGPGAINGVSQNSINNALAYAFTGSPSYSKNFVDGLNYFYLNPESKMNPNMNYGQVARGPTSQTGTFTGILDGRGHVKVVNAIIVMKDLKNPDWTPDRDQAMMNWMSEYLNWLKTSDIGKKTASRPNNHGSFYFSQVAAIEVYLGRSDDAIKTLHSYFDGPFMDQLAASGEQPFEAVRTRPFHYRCFNIEAMITNAKIGDQLGQDFWIKKSKRGATIKDAVDYTMSLDPKKENQSLLAPHVATIMLVHGDPDGKYAKYLSKADPDYRSKAYWYYDQPGALTGSSQKKRSVEWRREDASNDNSPPCELDYPAVFEYVSAVELEVEYYVTWEQLKFFYCPVAT
ncbi:chondroitin AC/alginate lyase [Desarmillaria tabescens]|uniref:Chondroitin AC/alginate lyase n=1 Tax=Armillaria tabescens TaxID=1929756 RepID=A0AA39U1W8_ARMTA|nr:chondroitin AC/alginate lyase [Desarmillaria tabescens]KAK0465420.1 chondroitin AC/alginate lyase [Desarmillaria tabescens]